MADTPAVTPGRSYGCSMGDGNPFDMIVIDVRSSDTLFLCVPCFIRIASEMVNALTSPDDPAIQAVQAEVPLPEQAPHTFDPLGTPIPVTPFTGELTACPDCGTPNDEPHLPVCAFAV